RQRAHARSIAHEMHAGFLALKSECPMNMRRRVEGIAISEAARKDVRRVEAIWAECLERYHGPFLFGSSFSIADGMFAPVVNRLQIYALSESPAVLRYTSAMTELPAWKQWHEDAVAEPWVVEIDEVYA
ncbi:MAG: glutathione S-transferase C-terminal domain-containing protein, partial [Myxococcota bacterium]